VPPKGYEIPSPACELLSLVYHLRADLSTTRCAEHPHNGWKVQEARRGTRQERTSIAEAIRPEKIILFGSWARGERGPHSDIDLLIIQESDLSCPQRYAQVRRLFWGMGVAMDILVYTPEEFARYQSVAGSFTHTVAREGKVLYARPGE
jgi:predicted nucleotidyltransferase